MAPRLVWKTRGCTYDIQLWKKFSRTATCFEQVQNCWHSYWRMASPPLQGLPRISSQTLQSDGASRKLSFLKNKSWISRNDTTKTQLMSWFVVGRTYQCLRPPQAPAWGWACLRLLPSWGWIKYLQFWELESHRYEHSFEAISKLLGNTNFTILCNQPTASNKK